MKKTGIQKCEKLNGVCECNSQNCVKDYAINYVDKSREVFYQKRYETINNLIDCFEDMLKTGIKNGTIKVEDVPESVSLTSMLFEALVKSIMGEDRKIPYYDLNNEKQKAEFNEQIVKRFSCLSPNNFFKLLNDISLQGTCYSSKRFIADLLESSTALSNLNKFYNEYTDIYNAQFKSDYSMLPLFRIIYKKDGFLDNIIELAKSKNVRKNHIACYIINQYENENRAYLSESSREELNLKIDLINRNISEFINDKNINLNQFYSIDDAFDIIRQKLDENKVTTAIAQ